MTHKQSDSTNKMRRWLALGLGTIGTLGAGATTLYLYRRQLLARLLKLPPLQNGYTVHRHLAIPTTNGHTLATDHYEPSTPGEYPTILMRTPYDRTGYISAFAARRFCERGYHVLLQDVRGRFGSDGEFEPFVYEQVDAQATFDWLAEQPWFNGQVGMWGQSYVGYVQWAAVATKSPYLQAIAPNITQSNMTPSAEQSFILDRSLRWMFVLETMHDQDLGAWERLNRLWRVDVQNRLLARGFENLPLVEADQRIFNRPVHIYQAWMNHLDAQAPYWQAVDHSDVVAEAAIPTQFVGGWYDIFLPGMLADYERQKEAGHEPHLTIGPYTHLAPDGFITGLRLALDWMDGHLKGAKEKIRPWPVALYVMQADEWRQFDRWPPAADTRPWYLSGPGNQGGDLRDSPPPADTPPSQYRYDPADPTPNHGGPTLTIDAGPRDNAPLETRDDVLFFTTPPLAQTLDIIGYIKLILYVKSSLRHTDFFGRLCDVTPDGQSLNICEGLFRFDPTWHSGEEGERQADDSIKIEVKLSATAYRFLPGHCIRVQVSSGAHPRLARNLGTAEHPLLGTRMVAADQTVFHDAAHPSHLLLPVVPLPMADPAEEEADDLS